MTNGEPMLVDVSKLHLDPENPRHDPITDEPAIIARLYGQEKVLGLAKSIAANGTSPLELMAVIPHAKIEDQYVVVEGNRRLCALKLLRDPQKAPTPGGRRSLEEAKVNAIALPKKVNVILFDNRATARRWIALRHEGEQGGAGTKKWTAKQISRHKLAGDGTVSPNAQALALVEYAQASGLVTAEERENVSLTTLTRYLGNPIFRHTLGLVDKVTVTINVDQSEFNRALEKFLRDALPVASGTSVVNSRSKQADWKAYAQSMVDSGSAPTTRLAIPILAMADTAAISNTGNRGRHSINPDKRAKVVPASFRVSIRDTVLKRIFDELRKIDPEEFSFSAAYLVRAFVEQTAVLYAKKYALGHQGDLNIVIGRCVKKLEEGDADRRACKPLKEMSTDKHSRLSPDGLGAWVHGSVIPTAAELKRRWDAIEPGFKLMLEAL